MPQTELPPEIRHCSRRQSLRAAPLLALSQAAAICSSIAPQTDFFCRCRLMSSTPSWCPAAPPTLMLMTCCGVQCCIWANQAASSYASLAVLHSCLTSISAAA